MKILYSSLDLTEWRQNIEPSKVVGFVPTMGALHDGHLSLVKQCIDNSDVSIISIFLNPKQFSKNEDLGSYPQNIESDLKQLKKLGVDAVFVPGVNDIYAENDTFELRETALSLKLEGKSRPHFFGGVLTVVSKLFNMVRPLKTFFGQKDAQQLMLIKKMVGDMKYPIEVVGCSTVREKNGLAMSSRNEYLTREERNDASIIYKALMEAEKILRENNVSAKVVKEKVFGLFNSKKNIKVDYVSVANVGSLEEIDGLISSDVLVSVAVYIRNVRLIDNVLCKKNNVGG